MILSIADYHIYYIHNYRKLTYGESQCWPCDGGSDLPNRELMSLFSCHYPAFPLSEERARRLNAARSFRYQHNALCELTQCTARPNYV